MSDYEILRETPSTEVYLQLRKAAGLGAKSLEAVERALPNTIHGVQVLHEGEVVGFSRLIGDDGCFYVIVDTSVLPEHQANGIGAMLCGEIVRYFKETAPPGAYLMASTSSPGFAKKVGFTPTGPDQHEFYIWLPVD